MRLLKNMENTCLNSYAVEKIRVTLIYKFCKNCGFCLSFEFI